MTTHHCTHVSVILHDADAGHFSLDALCNHRCVRWKSMHDASELFRLVVYRPSPHLFSLSPFTATSARSSLCFLLSLPQLLWLSSPPSTLFSFSPFSSLLPCWLQYASLFIPGSADLPMARIGTKSLHVSICAPVYVCGWRIGLEFHYPFPWPYASNQALTTYYCERK